MNPTLQILLLLGILILAAKAAGLLSVRLGQAAVLGELLAGMILGPTAIDLLHIPIFNETTREIVFTLGELGVIFLMFLAGLEVDLEGMLKAGRVAVIAGVLGVVAPLLLGTLVAMSFQYDLIHSLFIGLILTATSVSISAQTLLELGALKTREGLALLGAAVVDDVLVIFLLSLFVAFFGGQGDGDIGGIFTVAFRMGAFIVVAIFLGLFFIPPLVGWVNRLPISQGIMASVVIVTLLYSWSAEYMGQIAAITGAFIAGLLFARTPARRTIEEGMHTLTYAFFVPLFLIGIGLKANARTLEGGLLMFALAIIFIAIVSKIIGSGLGARLAGFNSRESLRVGVGMISRGEVGLIVASIGLGAGLADAKIYSTMVVMVVVTTLVTPILLRSTFSRTEEVNG